MDDSCRYIKRGGCAECENILLRIVLFFLIIEHIFFFLLYLFLTVVPLLPFSHLGAFLSFEQLMGLEKCHENDEECLKRRMVAEAHLDYIYTQHHKP